MVKERWREGIITPCVINVMSYKLRCEECLSTLVTHSLSLRQLSNSNLSPLQGTLDSTGEEAASACSREVDILFMGVAYYKGCG
jgi:hypothetical protein